MRALLLCGLIALFGCQAAAPSPPAPPPPAPPLRPETRELIARRGGADRSSALSLSLRRAFARLAPEARLVLVDEPWPSAAASASDATLLISRGLLTQLALRAREPGSPTLDPGRATLGLLAWLAAALELPEPAAATRAALEARAIARLEDAAIPPAALAEALEAIRSAPSWSHPPSCPELLDALARDLSDDELAALRQRLGQRRLGLSPRLAEAGQRLSRLLREPPYGAEAWPLGLKALAAEVEAQPDRAWPLAQAALRRAPDEPRWLALTGRLALARDELELAERSLRLARALAPEALQPRLSLIDLDLARGDRELARAAIDAALRQTPGAFEFEARRAQLAPEPAQGPSGG